MKILHVITSINRGGAENHLIELAGLQKEAGHMVAVAYLKGNHYWKEKLYSDGVLTFDLGLNFYGDIQPLYRLWKTFNQFKPDFVHVLMNGKIIRSGGPELAIELEKKGYESFN